MSRLNYLVEVNNHRTKKVSESDQKIQQSHTVYQPTASPGLEAIKLELILRLKIKRNDWLLSQSLRFILSLRL